MAYTGLFIARHPKKYVGDATHIVYRSSWERKFFAYCDDNPAILRWASEEFSVPYISPMDNRFHRYFPDVWLEAQTVNGIKGFVIEIKPKSQTQVRTVRRKTQKFLREAAVVAVNHAKWDAARDFCAKKGWTFLVVTEDHLFKGFR